MTITEYYDKAVAFIVNTPILEDEICNALDENPVERIVCSKHCQGFDQFCVKRFLKHYKHQNKTK